jgi:hypothetical protein
MLSVFQRIRSDPVVAVREPLLQPANNYYRWNRDLIGYRMVNITWTQIAEMLQHEVESGLVEQHRLFVNRGGVYDYGRKTK